MSFSISPSNEYSGLISLKIDLFHLLAVPTFRSLPQFEGINSLASCLLYSPGLTTIHDHWKDHSLDYMDLCQQCLCFSTQSRFIIIFLPRSNCLLISWLPVTIHSDFGDKEEEICHYFQLSPSICHAVMGPDAMISVFFFNI